MPRHDDDDSCPSPPLPREQLADHLNAEIVAGTIRSRQDALDYLTWTFFFRRLAQNPSYYDLGDPSAEGLSAFLSDLVEGALEELRAAGCVTLGDEDEGGALATTTPGRWGGRAAGRQGGARGRRRGRR